MNNVQDIPKQPGLYELNGKVNYTMNLQKKAKKAKGDFKIINVMPDASLSDLMKAMNDEANERDFEADKVVLHHYKNNAGWSITSIYNNMHYDGFEQVD